VTKKKLLVLILIILLLVTVPVTIFFLQKQQQSSSKATAATTLTFTPATTTTNTPVIKAVGDNIPLVITVHPGTNSVGSVKLVIDYDPTKLATIAAATTPDDDGPTLRETE